MYSLPSDDDYNNNKSDNHNNGSAYHHYYYNHYNHHHNHHNYHHCTRRGTVAIILFPKNRISQNICVSTLAGITSNKNCPAYSLAGQFFVLLNSLA